MQLIKTQTCFVKDETENVNNDCEDEQRRNDDSDEGAAAEGWSSRLHNWLWTWIVECSPITITLLWHATTKSIHLSPATTFFSLFTFFHWKHIYNQFEFL